MKTHSITCTMSKFSEENFFWYQYFMEPKGLQRNSRKQEMFQKHLCPPWCKIHVYLLYRNKTCTKQVTKGLKYIKWATHTGLKSRLTLTFEHVTWKSIRIIYLLGVTPKPSLLLIKWKGSKDIERTTQWAQKSGLTLIFEHVT